MSRREMERAAVLARVKSGSISLTEATPLLGLSYRQAKRLYARYRDRGATGLRHAGAGHRSNRAHPACERAMVTALVREHYGGEVSKGANQRFGPTLTAEHLFSDHGVLVPVRTLMRWMTEDGLWSRVRKSKVTQHKRRERKEHFGELVQLDGSFHDWLEGRGGSDNPMDCVMTMVDDATGKTLLEMGKEETTWAAANVLLSWIGEYGVPRALYTDWKNVYKRPLTSAELARGETEAYTQFGRMCHKLGIKVIAASTPQAKGRVERAHGTHQDRLVKELRLKGITDHVSANAYLQGEYTRAHNARFAVAPASPVDYHVPRDSEARRHLSDDDVFCIETMRTVSNDYVVQYKTRSLQLDRQARGRVPAKSKVLVRETEDGRLRVVQKSHNGEERVLKWTDAPEVQRTPTAVSVAVPAVPVAAPISSGQPTNCKPCKPAPDHPWRKSQERWVARAERLKQSRQVRQVRQLARLRRAHVDVHP